MMDRVLALTTRYFASTNGELRIGELPVSAIAERYGTPLFIYAGHVLDRKWDLLRSTFGQEFAISYSVKANPNPAILARFLDKGAGLEIASGGEFIQALSAGCRPERIMFAGPGKTAAELELVITNQIGEIHAESLLQIELISSISRRLGVWARVAVRVNPTLEAPGGAMVMGGKPSPFGVDEESLDRVVDRVTSDPCMEFRGIHLFTGTQILDHAVLIRQYRKGLEIASRVAAKLQRPLATVDFGGGLGIPYFAHECEIDMEKLREEVTALMTEIKGDPLFATTQFIVEPGRYLVGEAGIYVTRVNDIKVSRGKTFIITDGGMNHHLAASGNLGQVIKRHFPIGLLHKLDERRTEIVDVVGPLCTPLDVVARDVPFPRADVGDLIGIFQSGAYGRTASPLGFLSHPSPAEVLVEGREVRLIRRRGTHDDLFHDLPNQTLFGEKRRT